MTEKNWSDELIAALRVDADPHFEQARKAWPTNVPGTFADDRTYNQLDGLIHGLLQEAQSVEDAVKGLDYRVTSGDLNEPAYKRLRETMRSLGPKDLAAKTRSVMKRLDAEQQKALDRALPPVVARDPQFNQAKADLKMALDGIPAEKVDDAALALLRRSIRHGDKVSVKTIASTWGADYLKSRGAGDSAHELLREVAAREGAEVLDGATGASLRIAAVGIPHLQAAARAYGSVAGSIATDAVEKPAIQDARDRQIVAMRRTIEQLQQGQSS